MHRFLRILTRTIFLVATAATAAWVIYHIFVLPRLAPIQDRELAWDYSRVLSQTTAADLATVSIRVPDKPTVLSQIDARQLLQHLHADGRFPEWKSSFRLLDHSGKPLEITILPTPPPADPTHQLVQGDYTFTVKPSTLSDPVQYP